MEREPLFRRKTAANIDNVCSSLLFAQLDPELVEGRGSVFAAPLVPLHWLNDLLREGGTCFLAEDVEGL